MKTLDIIDNIIVEQEYNMDKEIEKLKRELDYKAISSLNKSKKMKTKKLYNWIDKPKRKKNGGNQETKVMTEAEYKASIGKKNYQWIRCALGLHKLEVIDSKPIDNIRSEVVGNIIISRCACCGKIKTKTIYTKDIR